jgi:hypothetical protein
MGLTIKDEHRLRIFEDRLLRRLVWPDRKYHEAGENSYSALVIFTRHGYADQIKEY